MSDDAEVEKVFNVPPEEFTATRNRLARQARKEGRTDLAIRLEGLRKPTAVVWVANQIARRHRKDVEQLLDAARALRQAQEGALLGGRRAAVAVETAEWRNRLAAVVRRGREIAETSGRRSFDESRLSSTLLGAAAREESASLLREGRLVTEIEPPGIAELFGDVAVVPQPARSRGDRRGTPAPRAGAQSRQSDGPASADRHRRGDTAKRQGEEKRKRQSALELARLRREMKRAEAAVERARKKVRLDEERVARESERLTRSREALAEAEKLVNRVREDLAALERQRP